MHDSILSFRIDVVFLTYHFERLEEIATSFCCLALQFFEFTAVVDH